MEQDTAIYIYIDRERALGCETLVSSRENYSKTLPKTNVSLLKNLFYYPKTWSSETNVAKHIIKPTFLWET